MVLGNPGTYKAVEVIKERGQVCTFLVNIPGAHAFWQHWMISVVSLKDIPGIPPATKHFEDAEHEIAVLALDTANLWEVIDEPLKWPVLTPANYVNQFAKLNDEQATTIAETIAKSFVESRLFIEPQGITGARELYDAFISHEVEEAIAKGPEKSSEIIH